MPSSRRDRPSTSRVKAVRRRKRIAVNRPPNQTSRHAIRASGRHLKSRMKKSQLSATESAKSAAFASAAGPRDRKPEMDRCERERGICEDRQHGKQREREHHREDESAFFDPLHEAELFRSDLPNGVRGANWAFRAARLPPRRRRPAGDLRDHGISRLVERGAHDLAHRRQAGVPACGRKSCLACFGGCERRGRQSQRR